MKNTTALTAFALAAYLYDQGYVWLPLALAGVAVAEYLQVTPARRVWRLVVFAVAAVAAVPLLIMAFEAVSGSAIAPEKYWAAIPLAVLLGGGGAVAIYDGIMKIRDEVLAERARRQPLELTEEVAD